MAWLMDAGGVERHHLESALYVLVIWGFICTNAARVREPIQPGERSGDRVPAGILLVVYALIGFLLYSRAIGLGLFSDDFVLLARAERGQFVPEEAQGFVRPVPLFLWSSLSLWAENVAAALHFANVLLHCLNALWIQRIARRLGADGFTSATAGVFFLSFPASVEAVAWSSGIFDVLLTSFALLFVLSLESRHGIWLRASLATILTVLALGTKETAVVLPVLGALACWRRIEVRTLAKLLASPLAACVTYGVWRVFAYPVPEGWALPTSWYRIKELPTRLFGTLGVPLHERVLADEAWIGVAFLLLTLALLTWSFWRWRADRASFHRGLKASLWGVFSILPIYGFFYVGDDLQGSRYVYLAASLWVILYADMVYRVMTPFTYGRRIALGLSTLVFMMWAAALVLHLDAWSRAARLRDRVLESAERVLAAEEGPVVFQNLPDSVEGAYVFRNGFAEALARKVNASSTRHGVGSISRWRWDGASFHRAE